MGRGVGQMKRLMISLIIAPLILIAAVFAFTVGFLLRILGLYNIVLRKIQGSEVDDDVRGL